MTPRTQLLPPLHELNLPLQTPGMFEEHERLTIRPASDTKDISALRYPLNPLDTTNRHAVSLTQTSGPPPVPISQASHHPSISGCSEDEPTTGTTLWLSSQLLTLYLSDLYAPGSARSKRKQDKKLKALELGSGIGLSTLVLASLGIDVVATDLPVVINQVLHRNIEANRDVIEEFITEKRGIQSFARCGGDGFKTETLNAGRIDVKVLDWTADTSAWHWDVDGWITPQTMAGNIHSSSDPEMHIQPPFDLIITSDTVYEQSLITPLLRVLYYVSMLSEAIPVSSRQSKRNVYPPIYLSLERRDSEVIDGAIEKAKDMGFVCEMVRMRKITNLMRKSGAFCHAEKNEPEFEEEEEHIVGKPAGLGAWDGVEIWKLQLKPDTKVRVRRNQAP